MFRKLHIRLTLFCTLVTGLILLSLTLVCFFFARDSLKKSHYAAFLSQLNTTLIHLQEQKSVSHQWLNQLQEKGGLKVCLYDNGRPLFYQSYHASDAERRLTKEAENAALKKSGINIMARQTNKLTVHREFDFTDSTGQDYYVSVGVIPGKNGSLNFLILSSPESENGQIRQLRLIICLADAAALFSLFLFSRYITKRMIIPLEKNQKRQHRFIASASHELRAPLSVLRSGIEALTKTSEPAEQAHLLSLMQDEATRMQNLIRDMLFLANSDSHRLLLQYTVCQPEELLLHTFESYESAAAQKGISLTIQLPEELVRDFSCDRERLLQIFAILISNAISYTPAGGAIELSLSAEKSFFLFFFRDTGCGVPDAEKKRIFDRFYRSDHAHTDKEHFGLGLGIAKEIVTALGGQIRVEDNPEGGSCFIVKIPVR